MQKSIRVLLQSRVSLFSVPGGDTVQMCKTAKALQQLGVVCEISTELSPDLSEWDIVHLFNLTRPQEVYLQADNARRHGKPIALSTIYLCGADYDRVSRGGAAGLLSRCLSPNVFEYTKVLARGVVNGEWNKGTGVLMRHGYHSLERKILRMAKVLLPNSRSEMQRVIRDFPDVATSNWVIVPNAVEDYEIDSVPEAPLPHKPGSRDIILCVAYIGHRKNQLRLVKALKGVDLPLVIIGEPTPNAKGYLEEIKREAGKNVYLLGKISDEKVLRQWYRAAKVHVLPSWMETTGLSSLEAGLAGCNLVITDRGDTREYFGDMAYYCEPGSEVSIREAILKAYNTPVCATLQSRIRTEFNWTKAAEATLDGYRQIYSKND